MRCHMIRWGGSCRMLLLLLGGFGWCRIAASRQKIIRRLTNVTMLDTHTHTFHKWHQCLSSQLICVFLVVFDTVRISFSPTPTLTLTLLPLTVLFPDESLRRLHGIAVREAHRVQGRNACTQRERHRDHGSDETQRTTR